MDNEALELKALEHIMSDASAEPMKLSYGLLKSITDNFSMEIGRGGFGVVYQGVLENGVVAVKSLMNLHALTEAKFLEEITCLKNSKHKNIIRFLGYCSEKQVKLSEFNGQNVLAEEQQKLLCFEYLPNGDTRSYLQEEKSHGDDWHLRYKMIKGICEGLHYLHGKQISHLDLKPENVMLDTHMEPKITDFGLSRFIDQGQSKLITENIVGTWRYIAPETKDRGEISSKSDIYALGIIIIELLTGIDRVQLDNWEESLQNMDCPGMRRCIQIARECTECDRHNRPTIVEVLSDLDELESMIPQSSLNQVESTTTFPQVNVYPLELNFPFVPNKKMYCELSMTNRTNGVVFISFNPEDPERYQWGEDPGWREYRQCPDNLLAMGPATTSVVKVYADRVEELPPYTDKLEIHFLLTDNPSKEELRDALGDRPLTFEAVQGMGFQLHVVELTAVFVSKEEDQALVADITCWDPKYFRISSMDVHPTEPWVVVAGGDARHCNGIVYIWNWETNEHIGIYDSPLANPTRRGKLPAKLIARKQWVVIGELDGSILVLICPTMHLVKEFKAHREKVSALAVHPTRPFLLSSSDPRSLKLWDWSCDDWRLIKLFEITGSPVTQLMFNPKHATAFASIHDDATVMEWRIGRPAPIASIINDDFEKYYRHLFTYIGDRHSSADIYQNVIVIRTELANENMHLICSDVMIDAAICHPTRPILVTVSFDGRIQLWDTNNYRYIETQVF